MVMMLDGHTLNSQSICKHCYAWVTIVINTLLIVACAINDISVTCTIQLIVMIPLTVNKLYFHTLS